MSFAHGSNDGQKGVGLVMLILMGVVPAGVAWRLAVSPAELQKATRAIDEVSRTVAVDAGDPERVRLHAELDELGGVLAGAHALKDVPAEQRWMVRRDVLLIESTVKKLEAKAAPADKQRLKEARGDLRKLTDYAPDWVLIGVALSLGIGTMVGWQRIVITVGEKIGKEHLTYAQGASAELVAMSTIGISAGLGLPVSTTHVLSSGVAGTMVAHGSGLQMHTVSKIASAWLLTLPVTMLLSGLLFLVFRAMLA
ncbi:inorganic phosphate transporter [Nannocystis sp.]|uniref:inorganic phosphate transporter n=1 Tax=Nannocystis sp. TaxID=1962667 RepID=UPI0025DC8A54|nr:inorganic phosphate transporter [Nannocystis sp.]